MNTAKHALTFFLSAMLTLSAWAVPAYRGWQERTLTDGTSVHVRLIGDEFYHFWETQDGKIAIEQEDGTFVITNQQRPNGQQISARRKASKMYQSKPRKAIGERNLAPKGLVILVQFANVDFKEANNATAFNNMLNQEGYSYGGATGSAVDYFKAQSNNTYAPTFDVFGPVTLPNNRVYYGEEGYSSKTGRTENDLYIADFVIDAVKAADDEGCDFSQYDSDNDGYVDIVYFFYAGKGQAAGGTTETIWPHNWSLSGALYYEQTHGTSCYYYKSQYNKNLPRYDSKYIDDYVCSAELRSDGNRSGIGTLCHEFSHVLGMPDYYDTEYGENDKNGITPGKWSIMDQGSYNNNEMTPPNYSLYDKYYMGWIKEPQLLAKDVKKNVTLTTGYNDGYQISGTTTRRAYNYSSDANPVYYIENRQKTGWDAYLPGSGMIVWKVKYNATIWENNEPNNTAGNPRYTIVPADGKTSNYGYASDLFPTSSVNSYTPYTGCAITEITKSGSNITFKYNGGVDKTKCKYEFVYEHCTTPADGEVTINAPLSVTITPNSGYTLDDASCWTVEMGGVELTYGTDFTYNASTNTFSISSLTDDVVIMVEAKLIRTVTWSVNGVTTPVNFVDGAALVLPSTPSDCPGTGGKKFVGWTANSSVSGSAPSDLFSTAGSKTVTANITYYAVYATASGSGGGSIEKATSIAVGDQVILVCESASKELSGFSTTSTIYGLGADYSTTPAGAYILDVVEGSSSETFGLKHNDVYVNWSSGNSLSSSSTLNANSSWTITFSSGNATIANANTSSRTIKWNGSSPRFACYTSGQTAVQLYKIGSGTTYSDYSLTCDSSTPTEYTVTWKACGETFHTQGFADGAALVLPAFNPADNAGKTFVGWTATEHHTGAAAPADLFNTPGSKTVTADVTYYAVFH
jgi:M6 family metalloprotease-like protein